MTQFPVLLSTDIGSDIDDALALLVLLNHPEIDLRGIYTVNGNVDARCYIAKHMVDLASRVIPVGRGVSQPLGAVVDPYTYFEDCLIPDVYEDERMREPGWTEVSYRPLETCGVIVQGVEHFAAQLRREPHIVLSTAPLTNIAVLLQDFPDAAENIAHLLIMGCSLGGRMEHNIRFDAEAAARVLASTLPVTIVPCEVCEKYRPCVGPDVSLRGTAASYVTSMLRAFLGAKLIEDCISAGLVDRLIQSDMRVSSVEQVGGTEQYMVIQKFKDRLLTNFDHHAAYLDRDHFLDDVQELISTLEHPGYQFTDGSTLARELREQLTREVSIADVYVPYCLLHPERVTTARRTLTCDLWGYTAVDDGDRHAVVTSLDLDHFKVFLRTYLLA